MRMFEMSMSEHTQIRGIISGRIVQDKNYVKIFG